MSGEPAASSDRPTTSVVLPTVLLVLTAVFAYLVYEPPLETARPQVPSRVSFGPRSVPDIGAAYARLWEDPLEAAFRNWSGEWKPDSAPDTRPTELTRDRFAKIAWCRERGHLLEASLATVEHVRPSQQETTPPAA